MEYIKKLLICQWKNGYFIPPIEIPHEEISRNFERIFVNCCINPKITKKVNQSCPIHIVRHPDVFIVPKIILEELKNNGTKYEWVDLTEEKDWRQRNVDNEGG